MHDGQAAVVGSYGDGRCARQARRAWPSRYGPWRRWPGNRLLGQLFLKGGELALGTGDAQLAALHPGNARGIIAAVFKAPQASMTTGTAGRCPAYPIMPHMVTSYAIRDGGKGAFFEGKGTFSWRKKGSLPPSNSPSFQKPLICCFAPQGNPAYRTHRARKKQGEMPQGTTILSVKPRPGKYPPKRRPGGRIPAPASTKKRKRGPPGMAADNACSAFLFPQAKKGKPSASAYGPVTSGHARQCHTIKRDCLCRQPLMNVFWGGWGGNPFCR